MQAIKDFFTQHKKSTIITLSIIAALILVLIISSAFIFATLNHKGIYGGISVNTVNISNLSKEEATAVLSQQYHGPIEHTVRLTCGTAEKEISLAELSARVDIEKTVEKAYSIGRNGNFFARLSEIFKLKKNPLVLSPIISCDEELLKTYIVELTAPFNLPGQATEVTLIENELVITRGVAGKGINIPKSIQLFKETAFSIENGTFSLTPEEISPEEPSADSIAAEFCREPIDADYKIENQRLIILEDKPGVAFDKEAAKKILDESSDAVIKIPVTVTPAQVTAEQIESRLFPDQLGTYTSKYNAGDVSRSHNVSLAAQKINEIVLAPGDVFSYNDVVGPRTAARGFKVATVYVGNKSVPGIGGGICQVSSTLFNAVVLADLEIVYRTNHSLPVSYVPLGRDATVSYGSIDFKFKNNTLNPVKIVASASGGKNVVSVYGIKDNPHKTVEMETVQTGSRAFNTVQTEDPTLPAGTVKVEQNGAYGSSFNTYKITKENGQVVKRELLTKSTYVPSDRVEIIGTMVDPSAPIEGDDPVSGEPTAPEVPDQPELPIVPPNVEPSPAPIPSPTPVPSPEPVPTETEQPTV